MALPGGRSQKLQDWFVNQGVPRYLRRHLPVLARGARVLWIPGLAAFTGRGEEADGLLLRLERADRAGEPGGA